MTTEVPEELARRLGYLLKHAWLVHGEISAAALRPLGITGRELAVLVVVGSGHALSQQEAARRLDIDRTTMVAMIDALAEKGLVERRPHPDDRRRNVVELTAAGRRSLRRGTQLSAQAERRFLAPLGAREARQFTAALRTLVEGNR